MVLLFFSGCGDGIGGVVSLICCVFNRLVWLIFVVVFVGSCMVGLSFSVRVVI